MNLTRYQLTPVSTGVAGTAGATNDPCASQGRNDSAVAESYGKACRAVNPTSRAEGTMLIVTELIQIPDGELEWTFSRSGGPGGQNVNKVASKALLRWKAAATVAVIPEAAWSRMRARFPSRFTLEGDILVQSQKYRDQERNREDCELKLVEMVQQSLVQPTARKASKPSKGAKRRRVADKRRLSEKKRNRRGGGGEE